MPVDVFISYRGADRVLARRLEQRLRSRWGSRVFRDETSLMAGRSWSEQLLAAMSQANVTLALVGPGWHVRDDGEDWVRDELLGAIKAGNPVLPVLVGEPDELKTRLADLPEAFNQQAVTVSSDLAGFDLHKVESALRNLGAFGERRPGGLGRELTDILPDRCNELISELLEGRSIVVSGASGSGRGAILRRFADAVTKQGGLLATSGTDLASRNRRTHCVIASLIDSLCALLKELPPEDRAALGRNLVNAVIDFGPDLLARKVLRPALLLPLGGDDSDQKILDAARRPTNRWAPFPPERLVSQSVSVIENFVVESELPLTLVIDNVESIDGSSKDLLRRLLRSPLDRVRLVLATSAVRESADPEPAERCAARALKIDVCSFEKFASISLHDAATWGTPGAIIQRWLGRHNVRLEAEVSERFDDSNPYYALSALWYLVDNGHLVEPQPIPDTRDQSRSPDGDIVTWLPARPDEALVVPSRDRLLDHMIEEFIPIRFRSFIEAGSLIGRRFHFSAAYAAVHPPESIDGQQPSVEAIKRWCTKADQCWDQLQQVDPDGSVIVCHRSADNERMINLAQVDLMTHLASQLKDAEKLQCHERLAQYFSKPIANDSSNSPDDQYRNARAAAAHWAKANVPRRAADLESVAARLAEQALAYPEAKRHYRRAIRLFTQLLANNEQCSTFDSVDHEDLLKLANCLYHLGQMTRLAMERKSIETGSTTPTQYFDQALIRLQELSQNLHDKRLMAPTPEQHTASTRNDLPEPNVIRHHIRLCETLSGWVNLEQAQLFGDSDREKSRDLLFDALRHAEAARGEADSRWLLAAGSAQLAQLLVDDAMQAQQRGNQVRSHNLAIEAQFHIERVIGLAAVSPEEDQNLEEPRSQAWTVLGQLFETVEVEPQLAEWTFNRMNDHRHDVSDLVDKMTDRRLGLFLLSRHCGVPDQRTDKARILLKGHERWAKESGIAHEQSDACVSLALLKLVEQSQQTPPQLHKARKYINRAFDCATDANQRQNACLLRGVLHAIENGNPDGIAFNDCEVIEAFRSAGLDDISSSASEAEILHVGWRTILIKLLRWCPHLKELIRLDCCVQQPDLRDESGWARHRFFSKLAKDDELQGALIRAAAYLKSAADKTIEPSSDTAIWRMLQSRVPTECYQHAIRTRDVAQQLLNRHKDLWAGDEVMLTLHWRDMAYAVAVHEWYRSTDPSRLLTLARESNMKINGHEWASPNLLSGRLAIQTINCQYGAAREIGRQRLVQIESMVTNWAKASEDAGPLEQIFYISVHLQEPRRKQVDTEWQTLAYQPGQLTKAYRLSLEERKKRVRQAGLPLVQDLHLLDAELTPIDFDLDDAKTIESGAAVEPHNESAQAPLGAVDDIVIEHKHKRATEKLN